MNLAGRVATGAVAILGLMIIAAGIDYLGGLLVGVAYLALYIDDAVADAQEVDVDASR